MVIFTQVVIVIGKRRFANRSELIVLMCLLLVVGMFYSLMQSYGTQSTSLVAVVSVDGEEVARYPLDQSLIFKVDELPEIVFEIKSNSVSFMHSDCPDKICMQAGFLSRSGQNAVCLPNKAILVVMSADGNKELDAIV